MTEHVNIISRNKELCKLLTIELTKMGLIADISQSPILGAKVYIVDKKTVLDCNTDTTRTLVIGDGEQAGSLDYPFLICDFRRCFLELLYSKASTEALQPSPITAELRIDKSTSTVFVKEKHSVTLSPTEFALFEALYAHKGQALSYEKCQEVIGGNRNKLGAYICFLRKKLECDGDKLIYSVRGKGFMLK